MLGQVTSSFIPGLGDAGKVEVQGSKRVSHGVYFRFKGALVSKYLAQLSLFIFVMLITDSLLVKVSESSSSSLSDALA